jgi:hypothetical protein
LFLTNISNASRWAGLSGLGLMRRSWIPMGEDEEWRGTGDRLDQPVKICLIVIAGLQS